MFTDSHCHLYFNLFDHDLPDVMERAWNAGLEKIVIPGIDLETSRQAIDLAEQDPRLYAAIGVHPNNGTTWNSRSLAELRKLAAHPKVVAIGEIGLDYYRDRVPPQQQRQIFLSQLDLAAEAGLPVIIHNRQARADTWEILSRWHENLVGANATIREHPGILHSFDGSLDEAYESVEMGFALSFSGPITFKNGGNLREIVSSLPLSTFMIETDAPFLTPHPHRSERNEPAFVTFIAEKIAEIKNLPVDEIALETSKNAAMLFRWNNAD